MKVLNIAQKLSLETVVGAGGLKREISGGYCGDLLSWVIGRAAENSAWITVMGNENAIAVAVLADIPMIILAENAEVSPKACERAKENNIALFKSSESEYTLAVKLSEILKSEVKDKK